ncbi:murein hydrolase activator EnvC family protein [Myceligenerans salitolerans]|nr:M23 family metallopeptidase [Myceligenerans salitolerans]
MNLVAAMLLTLALVVLPANPAYGIGGPHAEGREDVTASGHPANDHPATRRGNGGPPASPAGYVSPVGGTRVPGGVLRTFDAPESPWGAGHRGVDLAMTAGQEISSPAPGRVAFAGMVAGRGVVVVEHADGLRSSLEPVTPAVPAGTPVDAGEPVGRVAAGPGHCGRELCVHWGVRNGERYIDPLALLLTERPAVVLLPDG